MRNLILQKHFGNIAYIILRYDYFLEGVVDKILKGHTDDMTCASILPNNQIVTGSADKTCIIWNRDGIDIVLRGHTDTITCINISPDGQIITGSADKTCIIWNRNGDIDTVLRGHNDSVTCINIHSSSGQIISGSEDTTCIIWKPNGEADIIFRGHSPSGWIKSINILADGHIATLCFSRICIIWKLDGTIVKQLSDDPVMYVNFLFLQKKVVTGSAYGDLTLWKSNSTEVDIIYTGHQSFVTCMDVLLDGRIITGSYDKTCIIWKLNGEVDEILTDHKASITCVKVLPNGQIVTGSEDNDLILWTEDWRIDKILKGHKTDMTYMIVLSNGQIICESEDFGIAIWK